MDPVTIESNRKYKVVLYQKDIPVFIDYLDKIIQEDFNSNNEHYLYILKLYKKLKKKDKEKDISLSFTFHQFVSVFSYIPNIEDHFSDSVPKEIEDIIDRWGIYFSLASERVSKALSKVLSEEDLMD
ncbi:hypothetical protein [Tissierella sp.]|uniref:hypothetical protein n=1 Tax=Tissierella sp. TaxID=41274 RepID=UPI00305EE5C3